MRTNRGVIWETVRTNKNEPISLCDKGLGTLGFLGCKHLSSCPHLSEDKFRASKSSSSKDLRKCVLTCTLFYEKLFFQTEFSEDIMAMIFHKSLCGIGFFAFFIIDMRAFFINPSI